MTSGTPPQRDEQEYGPAGPIRFYWRPGCPFCMTLERSLNRMNVPFTRHNIWEDPADAAYVRSVANGNETVPTLAIGSAALVNPSAPEVARVIAAEMPDLTFDQPVSGGRLRKVLRRN